jgi:LuxR family transcriptional regulator, maltose regulon positive regulatory protein
MAEIVVKTRITPKKLSEKIVSRERLLKTLEEGISKNVILITAPAGYGKTTLVIDFLTKLNKIFAWLYIAPDINTLYSFIIYLIHSIRSLQENFGTRTLELLESLSESGTLSQDEKGSIAAVTGTFVNDFLSSFNEDIYIVIDDLQNAGNHAWLTHTFNSLIDDFPPNLHILITSRSAPEFNIARLNAKRNLLKIDAAELHFNYDETEKLINDIYSIKCSKNDITVLGDKIEGWITGLHLILQAYGNEFPEAVTAKGFHDENLFDFFANEIFLNLEPRLQNFLLSTCMTDSFTSEMSNVLLDSLNTQEIIDSLRKKNIFIESSADSGGEFSYSYHNLFKQFLVKKLYEMRSSGDIKDITGRIFSFYEQKNDTIRAIEFSLISENYDKALKMIKDVFEELFRSGKYDVLEKWLSDFPKEKRKNDNSIQLFSARLLHHFHSDIDSAFSILEKLITEKKSDLYVIACIEYADILLLKGKSAEAIKLVETLIKSEKDPVYYTKLALELAKIYYSAGAFYYEKIIILLDETIKLNDENSLREFHSEIYSLYGRVYQSRGEFSKSLHYFKNAVQLETNIFRKFQTLTNIVLLHSWSGEYLKAKEYLDKAEEIFSHYHAAAFKRSMLRIKALFKFEAGDYEDSLSLFSELSSYEISLNIKSFHFIYNLFNAESFILLGNKDKAMDFAVLAEGSRQKGDEFQSLMVSYHKAIIDNLEIPPVRNEKIFNDTHDFMEKSSLYYPLVQVKFHMADFYYKTGNLKTCLQYLNESLKISSEKQFNSYLIQHFLLKRYLFDYAVSAGIQKDYISSIQSELAEKESYSWLSEDCKNRIHEESIKLYDIALYCFGGTEILLRGVHVPEYKWIRKKSKLMLVYLLINHELKHTKEKILELFFGDLSASSADNVFHQSVTNLRNAVNPGPNKNTDDYSGIKKAKSSKKSAETAVPFISYEDKILRINPGFMYYVDAIEFSKLYSKMKSLQTDIDEKKKIALKAAELYKGEFLPGYYDDWIEELRTNLQNKFTEICEGLILISEKDNNFNDVIIYAEKLITADKLHENGFISIINAYTKTGNDNMARKKFSQLLKNYEQEYDEKPSKNTLNRIEEILLNTR